MRRLIMNGRGKTLLLIISLAFNAGACLAVAFQKHGDEHSRSLRDDGKARREWLSSKLKLSPEQTATLSASMDQLQSDLHGMERRHQDESAALANLLIASELDMNAVSVQVEKIAAVRNDIQARIVEHLVSMRKMLKPEQFVSFREFAGEVLSRSRHGRQRGEGGPGHGPAEQKPGQDDAGRG